MRKLLWTGLLLLLTSPAYANTAEPVDKELRTVLIKAVNESDSFVDRYDAEVWLLDMSNRLAKKIPDPHKRIQLLKQVHYEASRAKLIPELVLAVIEVESNFNRYAISRAGAMGLMQVMPFWLKEIGRPGDNLFNLHTNLRMGCTILRYYLKKEKGDLTEALMRYNGSSGSFRYTNRVFNKLDHHWRRR